MVIGSGRRGKGGDVLSIHWENGRLDYWLDRWFLPLKVRGLDLVFLLYNAMVMVGNNSFPSLCWVRFFLILLFGHKSQAI